MEHEQKTQLEQLGLTLLSYSKRELYLSMRFLGTALEALPFQMRRDVRGLGTEGQTLYFHTPMLAAIYEENPARLHRAYLHLLLHCMFYHPFRMQNGREKPDAELWQIACDIAVESVIDELNAKTVMQLVSDERAECYERLKEKCTVLTAEAVYYHLSRAVLSFEVRQRLLKEFSMDDHALWKSSKQDAEKEESQKEEIPPKWKNISESVKTELETYLRKTGTDAGTLTEVLKLENRKKQNLGGFLRKFAVSHEEVVCDEDSFDLNFYTYGFRLYENLPLIEPLEYKEVNKIEEMVIVIDTSGSCSGTAVRNFLEQTYAVLKDKNSFFKKFVLHILQSDVHVTKDTVITSETDFKELMEHFEVSGFGGTDFRPAFEYVEELRRKGELKALKGLLYFTDGLGTYPEKRTDYKTVFAFLKKLGDTKELPVPVWAERLILEEQDYEY